MIGRDVVTAPRENFILRYDLTKIKLLGNQHTSQTFSD